MDANANASLTSTAELRSAGLFATDREVSGNELAATGYLLAVYGMLWGAARGVFPLYIFALFPIFYSRAILSAHEVLHVRGPGRVNPVLRLLSFVQGPLTLGYAELRDIHLRHHSHLGSSADPQSYLSAARPGVALIKALFANELDFIRYVRERGFRAELVAGSLIRLALFVALGLANIEALLWYMLITRIWICLTEFFFHHVLHAAETRRALPSPPRALIRAGELFLGTERLQALLFHDIHHEHARVAAGRLHVLFRGGAGGGERSLA